MPSDGCFHTEADDDRSVLAVSNNHTARTKEVSRQNASGLVRLRQAVVSSLRTNRSEDVPVQSTSSSHQQQLDSTIRSLNDEHGQQQVCA